MGFAAHTAWLPVLMAGLPGCSAMVCVAPPFVARPAGSSMGSVAGPRPHSPLESRLLPPSVMASPAQLPPDGLLTMEFRSVNPHVPHLLAQRSFEISLPTAAVFAEK